MCFLNSFAKKLCRTLRVVNFTAKLQRSQSQDFPSKTTALTKNPSLKSPPVSPVRSPAASLTGAYFPGRNNIRMKINIAVRNES